MTSPIVSNLVDHFRADEYSYRVPTPPRIVVPPPSVNAAVPADFNLAAPSDNEFLANITYDNLHGNNLVDWSYERRREAQSILPFLYLGPLNAAKDRAFLQRENITMMVGIRQRQTFESRIMNVALRVADELGIHNTTVDLNDNRELVGSFSHINSVINKHLAQVHKLHAAGHAEAPEMGRVLVFCDTGNERSAGVVAAYLMETHESVDYIKAMQICQSQRFCVNFDDSMKRLLQGYWDILRAQRDVLAEGGGYSHASVPRPLRTAKRSLEMDVDEDMEEPDEDAARFERRNFAPFVNTA